MDPTLTVRIATRLLSLAAAGAMAACSLPSTVAERGLLSEPSQPARLDAATSDAAIGRNGRRPAPVENFGQAAAPVRIGRVGRVLPVVTGDRQVQLDYQDEDVVRVVREVVGDVLGLTVTIDPVVRGRVTLRTGGRVPLAEIPRRLDDALQPLGYGLAALGGRVRVGRIADLESAESGAGGETRLIPLRSVSASDVLPVLQPNVPEGVRLQADPAGRGLLATGQAPAIDAVQELVRLFDVDTLRSRSFGLYPLANAASASVLRELTAIYGGSGSVRFAAIDRLNAILVVADQPGALARVRRTLVQLDTAAEATANVHVYPVRFRRATDLADILSRTFGGATAATPARSGPSGGFGGLSVGPSSGSQSGLGSRVPGAAPTLPPDAAPEAPQAPQAPPLSSAELGLGGPVRVQADAGRNALVVLASPADYALVEQTIRRLDVRPRQVFLEGVIAEVTLNDALRYGIDASLRLGSNGTLSQGDPLSVLAPVAGGLAYVLRGSDVNLTIQALSAITDVKVVSAPRVLVLDNETATLQVGNQVPVLVRSSQSTQNDTSPIVDSVELRDTGVILAVRARIGAGGSVSLDVFQEVSDAVQTASSRLNSPTIQLRRLQSAIAVQSGDTVALGGLLRDSSTRGRSGIPILSSLPIVGALFGTRAQEVARSELLVLLTPRVVDDGADTRSLTDELRAKLGALAPDVAANITPPLPGYVLRPGLGRGVRITP